MMSDKNQIVKILLKILILFLVSCGSNQTELIKIDPTVFIDKEISLSQIADEIRYIPLDNSIRFGLVFSIEVSDKHIFISAKDIGILVFDLNGKFITKIGDIGRGPQEYVYYLRFAVDDNENIYIRDSFKSVKIFSINNLLVRTIVFPDNDAYFDDIEYFNSMLFIANSSFGDSKYDWIILDTLGNELIKKPNFIPNFPSNLGAWVGCYKYDKNIYYWNSYNDTVFYINPDFNYHPVLLFSPGNHRLPRSPINDFSKLSYYMQPHSLFETKQFYIFKYFFDGREAIAFINKENKEAFAVPLQRDDSGYGKYIGGISNDIDNGPDFQPFCCLEKEQGEYLLGLVNAFEFTSLKLDLSGENYGNSNVMEIVNKINETDNPVLMLVRLKQ